MIKLIVGFTGTRFGATEAQLVRVSAFLANRMPSAVHHGGCIGFDKQAHEIAIGLGIDVVLHPHLTDVDQATCLGTVQIMPRYGHLRRNRNIVDAVHAMVACPRGFEEELRSGTWATIRYARKIGRQLYVVYPDGRVDVESSPLFDGEAV
jgi:hypothetical protein